MSLIDGKVDITPKSDGLIDPIQLLKATYDSGVSVAEMNVIARGQIVKSPSGGLSLKVNPTQSFAIVENDLSHQLEGMGGTDAWVTINGSLYKKPADQKKKSLPASLMLTIVEIQKE